MSSTINHRETTAVVNISRYLNVESRTGVDSMGGREADTRHCSWAVGAV